MLNKKSAWPVLLLLTTSLQAASLTILPCLSETTLGGDTAGQGEAFGVNNDGIVVGQSKASGGQLRATYWGSTRIDLGTLTNGDQSIAHELSDSGALVVGGSKDGSTPNNLKPVRWTISGGSASIATYSLFTGGNAGEVLDVSPYGGTATGYSGPATSAPLWTSSTLTELFAPSNATNVTATGIDGFGNVIGYYSVSTTRKGIYWPDGATSPSLLPAPSSGSLYIYGISHDGRISVGRNATSTENIAIGHVLGSSNLLELSDLRTSGRNSQANDASSDGSVIVGESKNTSGQTKAVVWIASQGCVTIESLLTAQGVNLNGWTLQRGNGISPDGKTVCGYAVHSVYGTRAFVANIGEAFAPQSISVIEGEDFDGDLCSVKFSDNNRYQAFNDPFSLRCVIDTTFVKTSGYATPVRLDVLSETSVARGGLGIGIEAYNYNTSSFTFLGGATASVTDSTRVDAVVTNPSQYLNGSNQATVRLTWEPLNDEDPTQDGWLHSIDLLKLS